MEKTYKKIEEYLKKNFPGKKLVRVLDCNFTDLWGFNSMMIFTRIEGSVLYYKLGEKGKKYA